MICDRVWVAMLEPHWCQSVPDLQELKPGLSLPKSGNTPTLVQQFLVAYVVRSRDEVCKSSPTSLTFGILKHNKCYRISLFNLLEANG